MNKLLYPLSIVSLLSTSIYASDERSSRQAGAAVHEAIHSAAQVAFAPAIIGAKVVGKGVRDTADGVVKAGYAVTSGVKKMARGAKRAGKKAVTSVTRGVKRVGEVASDTVEHTARGVKEIVTQSAIYAVPVVGQVALVGDVAGVVKKAAGVVEKASDNVMDDLHDAADAAHRHQAAFAEGLVEGSEKPKKKQNN